MDFSQIHYARRADQMADWTSFSAQQGYRFWYRQIRRYYGNAPETERAAGYWEAIRALKNRDRGESEVRSPRLKALVTLARLKYWLDDVDRFSKWLRETDQEVVGTSNDSCDCPIARYLKAGPFDGYIPSVGRGSVDLLDLRDADRYVSRSLPEWAKTFIHDVDGDGDSEAVPKRAAIAALEIAVGGEAAP